MLDAPRDPIHQAPRSGAVLLVSADRPWLASATAFLVAATGSLSTAETAAEAIDNAMAHPPDVAVIAPPIGDGSALLLINQLTVLRDRAPLGIVYVTDREREASEHGRLMRAGANDWFPRGLPAREAADRVAALLAEIRSPSPRCVMRGPLNVDIASRRADVGGAPLELTPAEFKILQALAMAAGRIMSQRDLASVLGVRRGSRASRSIGGTIERLRDKLGAARGLLETNRRDGYRLRFVAPP
jgi:two-component system KDP operon response regulator KdpE